MGNKAKRISRTPAERQSDFQGKMSQARKDLESQAARIRAQKSRNGRYVPLSTTMKIMS